MLEKFPPSLDGIEVSKGNNYIANGKWTSAAATIWSNKYHLSCNSQ